ncbi:rod shape-determining protein RodA [Bacillus vallismortis]|uniref:rod shape-determining protein RodA n=1 Tax=Bacillus vallismortis TaxID=72361 RepID=UPI002282A46A|nr:rod shape-determining protein RodA [Bacillus vallismortis]MCI4136260.1 rod shape-determining protein RodA [Bacillus vallismortis]MCY7893824.1 rod shape-determining protein RodA [Bacillus vallismortis]
MKRKQTNIDISLLLILLCLFFISLLAVYSGSGQYETEDPFYFAKRQVIWYLVGFGIMAGTAYIDYELLERLALRLFVGTVFLLILVHFFGTYKNGSQRWLSFGVLEIQPTEFMKIILILLLASVLNQYHHKRFSFTESLIPTGKIMVYTVIPFFFILIQPDLGSALVILSIAFTLMLVSGISGRMIMFLSLGFIALITLLTFLHNYYFDIFSKIIKPHQLDRIYGWLSPHEHASTYGYQLTQSLLAIGSGQLTGSGFTQGVQVQGGKIPEAHTDFIFAVIGEEFGFMGAVTVICLYFLMIYRIIRIAMRSNSLFGVYISAGVAGLILFQVFQNIGMTIGLMPVTGLALPFISYGGSALLTNMIALGLVFSVNIRSKHYMFGRGWD